MALGIVVAYRGSGVINFAQGALAMYSAYVYFGLRTKGQYLHPDPRPARLRAGRARSPGSATWPSLVLTLASAVVLGLLVHLLVFRPLRDAPTLAKVAASIGLMLTLQSIVAFRFGTETRSVPALLPTSTAFTMLDVQIPVDRLILIAAAIAVAVGLWALFRFTRYGLATRAGRRQRAGRRPARDLTELAGRDQLDPRHRARRRSAASSSPR